MRRVGNYAGRTIVTEYGADMTTGINYNGPINGNPRIAFMYGVPNKMRELGMGSVYWPGLRDGDTYSIQERSGTGANISLRTTNESGRVQIQWAWGMGGIDTSAYYEIVNRNSGKRLDVSQASTADGGDVIQWTDNNGPNQQWRFVDVGGGYYKIVNRNSGKVLDVYNGGTTDGADVVQWSDNGGTNQQWQVFNMGSYYKIINRNSGKALDVSNGSTADGADVIQWSDNGGTNQQWQLVKAG
jgi:hypothetical protein